VKAWSVQKDGRKGRRNWVYGVLLDNHHIARDPQPGLGLSFLTRDKPWSSGFVQSSRHPVTVLQIEQCAQGHLGIGEEDMSYPIALYEAAHFRCME
jgi:hypothetical protein